MSAPADRGLCFARVGDLCCELLAWHGGAHRCGPASWGFWTTSPAARSASEVADRRMVKDWPQRRQEARRHLGAALELLSMDEHAARSLGVDWVTQVARGLVADAAGVLAGPFAAVDASGEGEGDRSAGLDQQPVQREGAAGVGDVGRGIHENSSSVSSPDAGTSGGSVGTVEVGADTPAGDSSPAGGVGAVVISLERRRQVEVEGHTAERDAGYTSQELVAAAKAYLLAADATTRQPLTWPWLPGAWRPEDRVRNLVKAGALIAAEIDRLHAAAAARSES